MITVMLLPVRHLNVLQNWDCQSCGNCCHEYQIAVSAEERRRILEQGWEQEAGLEGVPLFVRRGWWSRVYRLNHRADGACVFLSAGGRCRIHERFGAAAKPLACRLYPFVLIPGGDHWRVGLRYACPAAAASQGRPLAEHKLEDCALELEKQSGFGAGTPHAPLSLAGWQRAATNQSGSAGAVLRAPALQPGQRVDWPDLFRFVKALGAILRDRGMSIEQRWRRCLALARVCRQARFEEVTGGRLTEFLQVLSAGLGAEVPADPQALLPPSWVGRLLFRQAVALYARKDHGPNSGLLARSGPWSRLRAAWCFARGQGAVPRLHGWLPETTFARLEEPAGPLAAAAEEVLERYYSVKLESLQFCGPTNFGVPFWEGLESLALTLPVILWLLRAQAGMKPEEAAIRAAGMVDQHFGFNRALGTLRQRFALGVLVQRQELDRLIGWYSR